MTDWRLPENRREIFQRFYTCHLRWKAHPGLVYSWLPALAEAYDLDDAGRAWLVWLNGNTQNPCTSLLLLDASAGKPAYWKAAVNLWNDNFKLLEWDTDRRHQKSKFGEATEKFINGFPDQADTWRQHGREGWESTWRFAMSHPYMGRLSAWSMTEYARILLGPAVPDADSLLLWDGPGSRSHRNGLAILNGASPEAAYWDWGDYTPDDVRGLEKLGESLLEEARERNPGHPDVSYLSLESALCTYKSWHKPNRRYPGVYADMAYLRLKKAESRWGERFNVLWEARRRDLPTWMRWEDNPDDPGLTPLKQNWYRNTGQQVLLDNEWPDMECSLYKALDLFR